MKQVNLLTKADTIPWTTQSIEGKLIVLDDKKFNEEYRDAKYQLVLAIGGFGCEPSSMGNAIFVSECHNHNPEHYRIERYDNRVLGIAKAKAVEEWKKIYGEFNSRVLEKLEDLD